MYFKRTIAAVLALTITGAAYFPAVVSAPAAVVSYAVDEEEGFDEEYEEYEDSYFEFKLYPDHAELKGVNYGVPKEIVIPDTYKGVPVTEIGKAAFLTQKDIKSVTIPDSVKSIGAYAFYGCTSLPAVNIPDSVTKIGEKAFYGCKSLTSIAMPDSVSSIGDGAFWRCNNLVSVSIPDKVTSIGEYMFSECGSLESITIPDSVLSIDNSAFSDCESLTSVVIPDSVTSMGGSAFSGCKNLKSVTIPSSVTSIGSDAFWRTIWLGARQAEDPMVIVNGILIDGIGCSGDVIIPDTVHCIADYAFNDNRSLRSVVIPDSVTRIGIHAFEECDFLTSVEIPGSVISIGDYTFSYCERLASITIPDSLADIGGRAFFETKWLNDRIKENQMLIINGILIDATTCTGDVVIPDGVKTIGASAFYNSEITSVTIPDSVTSIGDSAFDFCLNLNSVTIPDSVKDIGSGSFSHVPVTSITLPGSLTSIGAYAFDECNDLTEITVPESVEFIGKGAFEFCSALESVTILNPDCIIEEPDLDTIRDSIGDIHLREDGALCPGSVLRGYRGSTTQKYAEEYNYTFIAISTGSDEDVTSPVEPGVSTKPGDANIDGKVNVADAIAVLQYIANSDRYPLEGQALINAEVDGTPGITGSDAITIQKVDAGIIALE